MTQQLNNLNKLTKMTSFDTGEIHLVLGPMYSGKSSELLKIIKKYKLLDIDIITINHSLDNRYGSNKIVTHDGNEIDCVQTDILMSLKKNKNYIKSKVIVIEEGQFFTDLFDFVMHCCYIDNKRVYIAGLNGDFQKKSMGDILKLIPECDSLVKLSALCMKCKDGTLAHFSKRITDNTDDILVGSVDTYIPVCRKHHT
jgi:thymidine kinase